MKPHPEEINIDAEEYNRLIKRVERRELCEQDWKWILAILQTFRFLQVLLSRKNIAIGKLRKLIFGSKSEKDKKPPSDDPSVNSKACGNRGSIVSAPLTSSPRSNTTYPLDDAQQSDDESPCEKKPDTPGHGKRTSDSWKNAICFFHPHETLKTGDLCLKCKKGKVYSFSKPAVIVRVIGQSPLQTEVHRMQRLRCSSCGWLFTAQAPKSVREYPVATPQACASAAIIKYQAATPFYRFAGVLRNFGVNIPRTKIWDLSQEVWTAAKPAWSALRDWAAQVSVLLHDDTKVRILSLMKENEENPDLKRKGMFTTSIVAKEGNKIAVLYFSGRNHAGENLRNLLLRRMVGLPPPTQVSDALSSNQVKDVATDEGGCMDHARRNFFQIKEHYPTNCQHMLDEFKLVYKADARAAKQEMTDQERLAWHQQESQPVMEHMKQWCENQFQDKHVEPNSDLGGAIKYFLRHYPKLTLFLRKAGVPISNAACERSFKPKILIRKDSYFYKTLHGSEVGDGLVSLIVTCAEMGENVYDYFVALQKNVKDVELNPASWLPWNFRARLAALDPSV